MSRQGTHKFEHFLSASLAGLESLAHQAGPWYSRPAFSHNGRLIAVSANQGPEQVVSRLVIEVQTSAALVSSSHVLPEYSFLFCCVPSWTPNDEIVAFKVFQGELELLHVQTRRYITAEFSDSDFVFDWCGWPYFSMSAQFFPSTCQKRQRRFHNAPSTIIFDTSSGRQLFIVDNSAVMQFLSKQEQLLLMHRAPQVGYSVPRQCGLLARYSIWDCHAQVQLRTFTTDDLPPCRGLALDDRACSGLVLDDRVFLGTGWPVEPEYEHPDRFYLCCTDIVGHSLEISPGGKIYKWALSPDQSTVALVTGGGTTELLQHDSVILVKLWAAC